MLIIEGNEEEHTCLYAAGSSLGFLEQLVSKTASLRALISVGQCDPWSYMYEMTCFAVKDKSANPAKYATAHDIFLPTQLKVCSFIFGSSDKIFPV